MHNKICLVLGAGASHGYGYPLGSGLRKDILELCNHKAEEARTAGVSQQIGELKHFGEQFLHSGRGSIDAFLAHRPQFSDIGKRLIAHVLLRSERQRLVLTPSQDDEDLYGYLVERFCSVPWEEIDLSNLSIVSFNYDRSLEMALLQRLTAAYGIAEGEVLKKLRSMQILHVYGCLSGNDPWHYDNSILPYGQEPGPQELQLVSEYLKVIPDVRHDETVETFAKAQDLLKAADAIAFLGFAFDERNVERLGGTTTCSSRVERPDGVRYRTILATTLGMTRAEADYARRRTYGDSVPRLNRDYDYFPARCVELLRETGLLLEA